MNNDDQKLDRLLTRTEEQLTLVKSSAAAGNENPLLPTVETLAETVALLASAVKKQQNGLVPIDQLLKNPDLSPTMKAALEVIRPSPFKLLLPAAKQSAAAAGAGDGGVGGPPAAKVPRKEEPSASAASTPAPAEDAAAAEVTQLIEQLVDLGTVETIKKALPQIYSCSFLSAVYGKLESRVNVVAVSSQYAVSAYNCFEDERLRIGDRYTLEWAGGGERKVNVKVAEIQSNHDIVLFVVADRDGKFEQQRDGLLVTGTAGMACVLVGYQTAPINERARKLTFSAGNVSAANSLLLNTSTGAFPDNYGSGVFTEDGRLLGIVSESITRTHKSPVTSLQQRKKVAAGELFHSMAKGVLTRVIPAAVIEHLIQGHAAKRSAEEDVD